MSVPIAVTGIAIGVLAICSCIIAVIEHIQDRGNDDA